MRGQKENRKPSIHFIPGTSRLSANQLQARQSNVIKLGGIPLPVMKTFLHTTIMKYLDFSAKAVSVLLFDPSLSPFILLMR
jgi:hypothetical protein